VAPVQLQDVRVEARAPVDLRPLVQADVGSKTLGYLDAVLVDRGDRVKKGQLLCLVRPSDLPDQLSAARGALSQAQAQVALARANHERASKLAPSGVVSQQELQQATTQLAAAEAQHQAAQAQLQALAVRLRETRIESPLDGVVVQRRLDPGALVGPATGPILTVARVDVLRVFLTISERDTRGLAVGQEAHVEVDALPGRSFWGKVVRLSPAFDPNTRTLDAEAHLDNASGELRPGMYGRGAIVIETRKGAVVPDSAVQLAGRRAFVYVLGPGRRVARRAIELGVDGGTWLEVVKGLRPGEEVVTAGVEVLSEGMEVRR
jgi:RND family efflux transporter MFP subunit